MDRVIKVMVLLVAVAIWTPTAAGQAALRHLFSPPASNAGDLARGAKNLDPADARALLEERGTRLLKSPGEVLAPGVAGTRSAPGVRAWAWFESVAPRGENHMYLSLDSDGSIMLSEPGMWGEKAVEFGPDTQFVAEPNVLSLLDMLQGPEELEWATARRAFVGEDAAQFRKMLVRLAQDGRMSLPVVGDRLPVRLSSAAPDGVPQFVVAPREGLEIPVVADGVATDLSTVVSTLRSSYNFADTCIVPLFGDDAGFNALAAIKGTARDGSRVIEGGRLGKERLLQSVAEIDEDVIVVVGRIAGSGERAQLEFLGAGDEALYSVGLAELRETVARRDRRLIVLGCGSGRTDGITGPASDIDASLLAERLKNALYSSDLMGFVGGLGTQQNPIVVRESIGSPSGRHRLEATPVVAIASGSAVAAAVPLTQVHISGRASSRRPPSPAWSLGMMVLAAARSTVRRIPIRDAVVRRRVRLGALGAVGALIIIGMATDVVIGIMLVMVFVGVTLLCAFGFAVLNSLTQRGKAVVTRLRPRALASDEP